MQGAAFCEAFYTELVAPLLERHFPRLRYAAGRLGRGSEVLGFDDDMSRDHDWGARLTLLVDEAHVDPVHALLARELPDSFRGHPVRFPTTGNPVETHQVEVATVMDFAASHLGVDPRGGLSTVDWLCLTGHSVLETTAGPVFRDDTTQLAELKALLRWYPPEVESFVLASGWLRVASALPFVGRTAQTGQELQSRVIAAGVVKDLVALAFLRERQWMPYAKWREAGFRRLPIAAVLQPHLDQGLRGSTWSEREDGLVRAAEALGATVIPFFDRPYRTVEVDRVSPLGLPLIGSIEQWVDSFEILARPQNRRALIAAYRDLYRSALG